MTVQYSHRFFKALFHWRGSVWKAVWKELLIWLSCYYLIKIIITFAFPESSHDNIKALVKLFDLYTGRLPLELLLGFYVATVAARWWTMVMAIPEPHENMASITSYIHEDNEENQRLRHTMARYFVLMFSIGYKKCSSKIRDLFPTNDSFVKIGLMTQEECDIIDKVPEYAQYECPLQWITEMFRARVGPRRHFLEGLTNIRGCIVSLAKHDAFPIPLVYTQTATVAVYGFFTFCLIGHQFYEPTPQIDTIFPFLTVLRFLFGVGWLKIAQELAEPFGVDDEDIDLCECLSNHCISAFYIADFMPANRPINSWNECGGEYDKLKQQFDLATTDCQLQGKTICDKMIDILHFRK